MTSRAWPGASAREVKRRRRLQGVGYVRLRVQVIGEAVRGRVLADRAFPLPSARYKAMFFPAKGAAGDRIDYGAAVSGEP